MNTNDTKGKITVRVVVWVFLVITAAWQILRPGVPIIPGLKLIEDKDFVDHWTVIAIAMSILYIVDLLTNLRWLSELALSKKDKAKYNYTIISQVADILAIVLVVFQVFFSPV